MDVIHPRCAGLDVHKQTVVACARIAGDGPASQEVRTFETTTSGLLALADWLESLGIEHVAMEATGVYWKPVWHILEGHFELVLANAAHVKNVPGRKTDVNDAMWLADLLAHGLIRASFVPPTAVQELRTLTRTRKQFVRERGSHAQRLEKILEDANLKLSSVISDVLGKSGRAVLKALIDGQTDPQVLVGRIGRVKATRAELLEAGRQRLLASWPKNQPEGLVWGDARIGNMMFDENFDVVAVMDWEQPSLGGALHDLAWFCTLAETMHGKTSQLGTFLEGMGSREETIALWEEVCGKSAADLEWYEEFTHLKMSCTGVRLDMLRGTEMLKPEYIKARLKI